MTPQHWRSVELLFNQVADAPAGERTEILGAADPDLRREVERLLAADSHPTEAINAAIDGVRELLLPARFGPYRVTGLAGRGGMGAVYRAIRDDGVFEKQVAIKVMHTGLDAGRFRQERAILASLEHPNIARLLDGGETDTGASYIVLEFVDGLPLLDYCEQKGLTREARLRLFMQVCSAVQYAHQNLVVHRDLKPGNILVTPDGTPKLLDFGIAKLLDADSERTATAMQALTPDYASPEQILGGAITTATDVYSLGMILYELLTGRRPYIVPRTSPTEAARVICETLPQTPRISGDLDNILLMALRKEPQRRYASVQQLRDDVERHLSDLPVVARPDTVRYRTSKFFRRYRFAVASVVAVILALGTGAAIAVREARQARERFNDVRALANRFLFDFHDSIAEIEGTTKARALVVSTALDYLERLGRNASSDPSLEREVAAAYVKVGRAQGFPGEPNLGRIEDARRSFTKAVDLYERAGIYTAEDVRNALEPMRRLATLETDQGNIDRSLAWSNRALSLANRIPLEKMTPALAMDYAVTCLRRQEVIEAQGDSEAAYRAVREGESILNQFATLNPSAAFDRRPKELLTNLETAARMTGRLEETEAAADELLRKWGFTAAARRFHDARVSELYCSIDQPSWDNPDKAIKLVLSSVGELERGLQTDPNDINMKYSLAVNNSKIGYYLRESDPQRAVHALEYSIGLFESMARQDPGNIEYPARLTRYRARMAVARSYLHQRAEVVALCAQVMQGITTGERQARLHALNLCGLALANVGDRKEAARRMAEATQLAQELVSSEGRRMSTMIEATRSFEQEAEFRRRAGDTAGAGTLLEQSRVIWLNWEPATTYVRLRRARAQKLAAALRAGAPLQ
jgi:tRNA A-37 threonylcarbamoyl transferase component Bud32/tetratricopeptide (TPR) repeat protein